MNLITKTRHTALLITALILTGIPIYLKANIPTAGTALIKLPPQTVHGQLPNGLNYYIVPNNSPNHTTEFRMIMRVGSLQEEETQKGGAHFLEHMAFAGSQKYPGHQMIDYFEKLGMKFGRDINAVTGFDRTIFMLTVPMNSSDKHISNTTLQILKECLTSLTLDSKRIEKEKGVILEELRGYRQNDDFYSLKIGQNRFSNRMPLGNSEDISSMTREKLINYYKQWYIPSLTSIVVVGNVIPNEIEHQIKDIFTNIRDNQEVHLKEYPLSYPSGVTIKEVKDDIERNSELEVIIPHKTIVGRTIESNYQKELPNLLAYALNNYFSRRKLRCHISDSWYLADQNHFAITINEKDKSEILNTLKQAATELHSIEQRGFNPTELESDIRDFAEKYDSNSFNSTSSKLCDDLIDLVISGERYIHTSRENKSLEEKILNTTSQQLQECLRNILNNMQKSTLICYRNNKGASESIRETDITENWENGQYGTPIEYCYREKKEETTSAAIPPFLQHVPPFHADLISWQRDYHDIGVTEIQLKNEFRTIMRPTNDASMSVNVTLIGRGGLADLSAQQYRHLEGTAGYIEMGGIEGIPYEQYSQIMSQENVSLSLSINAYWHYMMGMSSNKNMSLLFNLMYEKMHHPELNYNGFEEVRQEELQKYGKITILEQMMERDPERMMSLHLDSLMGNSPKVMHTPITAEDIKALNLRDMCDYYKALFTNPDGMTLIMTGNFDIKEAAQKICSIFGRMAHHPSEYRIRDTETRLPSRRIEKGISNDNSSQTIIDFIFANNYQPSLKNGLTLKIMRDIIQNRLLSELREKEHMVYSPYTLLSYDGIPDKRFYFDISISVAAANAEKSKKQIYKIIRKLQRDKVTESELNNIKRSFIATRKQVLSDDASSAWRDCLLSLTRNGEAINDFENYENSLDSITTEDVRKAFRKGINLNKTIILYIGKYNHYE